MAGLGLGQRCFWVRGSAAFLFLIRSTTGCQAALGDGNGLTDRSRESPLLPRSNELHEQSEDEKAYEYSDEKSD